MLSVLWIHAAELRGWIVPAAVTLVVIAVAGVYEALRAAMPERFDGRYRSRVYVYLGLLIAASVVASSFGITVPVGIVVASGVLAAGGWLAVVVERHQPRKLEKLPDGTTRVFWLRLVLVGINAGLAMGVGVYIWSAASSSMVAFADPEADSFWATWLTPVSYLGLTFVGWLILALTPGVDPRRIAVVANGVVAAAFVALAGGSLLIDPGPARLALLFGCVLVAGAAGGIVPQLLTTTVRELGFRRGSTTALFFGVWAISFGMVFFVVTLLVGPLGVRNLLWLLAATVGATMALPRLLPAHPTANSPQPPVTQQWLSGLREWNKPLTIAAVTIIALQGFVIQAKFGPLDSVSKYYEGVGAPWAQDAGSAVGVGIMVVAFLGAVLGMWTQRLKPVLYLGALVATVGSAVGVLPLFIGDQVGGITTVISTLAVEGGHDLALMVIVPALSTTRGPLAWQFAGKYALSVVLVFAVPATAVIFTTAVTQNYMLSMAGAIAGAISLRCVPWFIRSLEQSDRKAG